MIEGAETEAQVLHTTVSGIELFHHFAYWFHVSYDLWKQQAHVSLTQFHTWCVHMQVPSSRLQSGSGHPACCTRCSLRLTFVRLGARIGFSFARSPAFAAVTLSHATTSAKQKKTREVHAPRLGLYRLVLGDLQGCHLGYKTLFVVDPEACYSFFCILSNACAIIGCAASES